MQKLSIVGLIACLVVACSNTQVITQPAPTKVVYVTAIAQPTAIAKIATQEPVFGQVSAANVTVDAKVFELQPIDRVILTGDSSGFATGNVYLAPADIQLPEISQIVPPCVTGETFYLTGYTFTLQPYHPGVDGRCTINHAISDGGVATAAHDAIVVKLYENLQTFQQDSKTFWVSGRTYILAATQDNCTMYTIYGHLQFPTANENWPQAGDIVQTGAPLGNVGATGNATGPHLHFGIVRECDGKSQWINPYSLGLVGGN